MTETPRTAAGRRLVAMLPDYSAGAKTFRWRQHLQKYVDAIRAIEAGRDELREALARLVSADDAVAQVTAAIVAGDEFEVDADGVAGVAEAKEFDAAMEKARALLRATEGKQP